MSTLERRLHILLDQERYARLEAEATERGSSVAAVVRRAIDEHFDDERQQRRRSEALHRLLSYPADEGPVESLDDLLEARSRDIDAMLG